MKGVIAVYLVSFFINRSTGSSLGEIPGNPFVDMTGRRLYTSEIEQQLMESERKKKEAAAKELQAERKKNEAVAKEAAEEKKKVKAEEKAEKQDKLVAEKVKKEGSAKKIKAEKLEELEKKHDAVEAEKNKKEKAAKKVKAEKLEELEETKKEKANKRKPEVERHDKIKESKAKKESGLKVAKAQQASADKLFKKAKKEMKYRMGRDKFSLPGANQSAHTIQICTMVGAVAIVCSVILGGFKYLEYRRCSESCRDVECRGSVLVSTQKENHSSSTHGSNDGYAQLRSIEMEIAPEDLAAKSNDEVHPLVRE
eukprot:gnl/MRDRNA2_/MRDRNA2_27211_c0_seq1.p1 gnl/MRDRNA2_/MRDRNA2_27211_c0~~gnl/MRDRNA2_/MRDRNA2_27211_c0_seq1.p1  ORF type:complete len:311 (+),score=110.36 gnl/MRDRNA2_/MRDRNA2_27211_c0_seq1:151-1083(+)